MSNVTLAGDTIRCVIDNEVYQVTLGNLIVLTPEQSVPVSTYIFSTPSDTWTVTHNYGRRVIPKVFTSGGVEMDAEITHINNNVLQVKFITPMSGYVVLV